MNPSALTLPPAETAPVTVASIPELVAEVFEAAPPVERAHLLEQLLRPLGVLSLFGIAGGVFANIRFRSGWQEMHVRLEDMRNVHANQIVALVDHAQQVSVETVDGLAQLLTASPLWAGSAAAGLLVSLLLQRARARQGGTAQRPGASPAQTL